jgi:hypothetical protein
VFLFDLLPFCFSLSIYNKKWPPPFLNGTWKQYTAFVYINKYTQTQPVAFIFLFWPHARGQYSVLSRYLRIIAAQKIRSAHAYFCLNSYSTLGVYVASVAAATCKHVLAAQQHRTVAERRGHAKLRNATAAYHIHISYDGARCVVATTTSIYELWQWLYGPGKRRDESTDDEKLHQSFGR